MARLWIPLCALAVVLLGVLSWLDRQSEARDRRTLDAAPAETPRSDAAAQTALSARTSALEQLADRCAPQLWRDAEQMRDAAAAAQREAAVEAARLRYGDARRLYDRASAEASVRLARGTCVRAEGSGPTLALPEIRSDEDETQTGYFPTADEPTDPYGRPEPQIGSGARQEADTRVPAPRRSDPQEVELRSRATRLVEAGQACEGVALLRREGSSPRTRQLAIALEPACRSERRRR